MLWRGSYSSVRWMRSQPSNRRAGIATRDRLPSLTGLRFGAALLVVLYHLTGQVGAVQPISAMVMFGRTGVTFFFVLSGFVLAWTYAGTATKVKVFWWRRFSRVWPLLAVTSLLSLAAFRATGQTVSGQQAASTFIFLQAWHPDLITGSNPAAWSLSDEAFFYAGFPLLLLASATAGRRRLLSLIAVLALPALWLCFGLFEWSIWAFDYLPLTRGVQFLIGVLCGLALRRGVRFRVRYGWAVIITFGYHGLLLLWVVVAGRDNPFSVYSGAQWWAAPVFAVLIVAAAQRDLDGLPTGVSGPWLIRLGHWSYAWYLIHEIFIRVWVHHVPRSDSVVEIAAEWLVLLVATTSFAGILYTLVEHPAERWLRMRGPQFDHVVEAQEVERSRERHGAAVNEACTTTLSLVKGSLH